MDVKLDQYRNEIDAIDAQIIALIKDRIKIVGKVGELKREHVPDLFPIRPAREARMIRRIVKEFAGSGFSPAAAAQIWRVIIGASTATEATLSIIAHPDCAAIAREYFSAAATITAQTDVQNIIADVVNNKAAIGIVPAASDWWKHLPQDADAPKVFAHLPFVLQTTTAAPALAIARVTPEDSGDDISLYLRDGKLVEKSGFQPLDGGVFLGAYAKPFHVEA